MALAYVTVSSKAANGSSGETLSHTVSSGTDRLLVVHIGIHGNATTPSNITWNGTAMTLAQSLAATGNAKVYIYYLASPEVGTFNVGVDFSGSTDYTLAAFNFTGADQSSPIGAKTTGQGSAASFSRSLSTNFDNSIVLDGVAWAGRSVGEAGVTETNQTRRWVFDSSSPALEGGGSTRSTTTAGSYSMGWNNGVNTEYAHVLVEIKEVQTSSPRLLTLTGVGR